MNVFKKIANIVFFKVIENGKEVKRAFVFYNDGTYEKASFDEGKKAVMALAKDKGFNSETGLQEIMNSKYVFVLDGNDLKNRFSSFIVNEKLNNESVNRTINKELDKKEAYVSAKETKFTKEEPKKVEKKAEVKEEVQEEAKDIPDYDVSIESSSITSTPKKKGKIRSFLDRVKDKIKKSPIGAKITALVVATAILLGLPGCAALKKHSKEGVMANSNLSAASDAIPTPYNNGDNTYSVSPSRELVYGNNDYYDDYTYAELLQVTTNASQKTAMSNLYNTMIQFNGAFADAHMEEGKSIRAALTFDEVIALQLAYNPYSKAQIRAIFNGADLDAAKLSRDYRNGTLQLMGAHVIETRENPVDMSGLLEDEESIQIYKKYHELFLAAKTATGEAKLAAIKAFYEQVRADFPLGVQERTEGISHSAVWDVEENRKLLPVTPMIAAAEIMFQNEKQKLDLGDQEIEFLNNLGLCNLADSAFERAQLIVLGSCEEDNTNPLYEQYRNAIIDELVRRGYYVVDDAHRDLSKLDAFQEAVNAHDHGRFGLFCGSYTKKDNRNNYKSRRRKNRSRNSRGRT